MVETYNGYTNFQTYMTALYFFNGEDNHINAMLKIKCFKGIEGFKEFALNRLKNDKAFLSDINKEEYLKECDWEDIFKGINENNEFILVNSSKELLEHFTAENNKIYLPDFQLDRALYLEVKATIESYGYKYIAGQHKRFEKKDANALSDLANMLDGIEILSAQKQYDFYPTPELIVKQAQELLEHDGESIILEPSCGNGDLIKGLTRFVEAIEINPDCRNILLDKNIDIVAEDFESFNPTYKYKYILMNPPFSKLRDAKHILKAYDLLETGGTIVAIASIGILTRTDKYSVQVQSLISKQVIFDNKEFKQAGTNIGTVLLKIKK